MVACKGWKDRCLYYFTAFSVIRPPPLPPPCPRVTKHGPAAVLGEIPKYICTYLCSWAIFVCIDIDTDVDVGSRHRHLDRQVGRLTDRVAKVLISVIACTWRFLLCWRNCVCGKKIHQKMRTRAIIWTKVGTVCNKSGPCHKPLVNHVYMGSHN